MGAIRGGAIWIQRHAGAQDDTKFFSENFGLCKALVFLDLDLFKPTILFFNHEFFMNPVVQEEMTGCGIACVATLAGVPYREVKAVAAKMGILVSDSKLWSDTNYVRKLCARFDIKLSKAQSPFLGWDVLPDCAFLAIKWHIEDGMPFWHWTVFNREKKDSYVLDPKKGLKTNKRMDFGKIKPKWFIVVYF